MANTYEGIVKRSRVIGSPGSNCIEFKLKAGESIVSSSGSLLYMKGNVSRGELAIQGVGTALARLFAGETFFFDKYTGEREDRQDGGGFFDAFKPNEHPKQQPRKPVATRADKLNGGTIALGSFLPGDIILIKLSPGQSYILSRGTFLASTVNVTVSAGIRMLGLLGIGQEEGFVLPKATCSEDDGDGYVWVAGYGTFTKHDIQADDELIVNNGLFLACDAKVTYSLTLLGKTVVSSFLGGEGVGMKFTGPCTVYTQSKNINDFIDFINMRVSPPPTLTTAIVAGAALEGAASEGAASEGENGVSGEDEGNGSGEDDQEGGGANGKRGRKEKYKKKTKPHYPMHVVKLHQAPNNWNT